MKSRLTPSPLPSAVWPLLALAVLLLALPTSAATFVMVTDQYLVESSAAAVQARVLSVDNAPGLGMPATDVMIEVERVLAGGVSGRNLIVRIPGGVRSDGVGLHLDGVPRMVAGERVVLFLNPNQAAGAAGTWGVSHLMMGAFHEVVYRGERLLVRNLTGATELAMPGEDRAARARFHRARKAEAFTGWVEEAGRGAEPEADYFYEAEELPGSDGPSAITGRFRLFEGENTGRNIRWFHFDRGEAVDWRILAGGHPGFSQADTERAIRDGVAAWNNDNGSTVNYRYVGTTGSNAGFSRRDFTNSVIYNNADNSIIGGDFSCSGGGGTLAIGGPWFFPTTEAAPDGKLYHVAVEGDIITNKGIECLLERESDPVRALGRLLSHELGHTLGIDHLCEPDEGLPCSSVQTQALMNPFLVNASRGAVLEPDDRNAARALYPGAGGPTGPKPAAPTGLAVDAFTEDSVLLSWNDNADDEQNYIVQQRVGAGTFVDVVTLPADSEAALLEGLLPETLYGFRVRGRNANGNSAYSNTVEVTTLSAIPAAPTGLAAVPLSKTSVGLTWNDVSDNETDYVVEARNPSSGTWAMVKQGVVAPAADTAVTSVLDSLTSGVPYSFRVRARNGQGSSEPSNVAAATPPAVDLGSCEEADGAICLLGGRFRVSVMFRNQFSATPDFGTGQGARFPQSDRTGTFWFFNQDNVELIVKVLDGTGINDFYWTFYGALSNVEYWVTVLDTTDGSSRTYYNPPGFECGEADTTSIPGSDVPIEGAVGSPAAVAPALVPSGVGTVPTALPAAQTGTCVADDTTLCLLDDRFRVEVAWANPFGESGAGQAVPDPGSDKTGYFWFNRSDNIELVVKSLDGGPVNGNFWFFYGALSNVQYTIVVTDTVTAQQSVYVNDQGNYCGQLDTEAFIPDIP